MPATAEFSYDTDVKPYASKLFDRIGSDRNMSTEQVTRLQSGLLGGVEGIEAQRLELQKERDMGRKRKLDYQQEVFALEEARARRTRIEQMEQRRAGVTATAKSILDSADDPETKRQMLARTALDYTDDPLAKETFDIAASALPKERSGGFTPNQIAGLTAKLGNKVAPEDLPTVLSDPMLLGQALAAVAKDEEDTKEAKRLAEDQSDQARAAKLELAKMPLKFAKDAATGEMSDWLEDSSTAVATKVVEALGTPAEKERFAKLKTAASDRERALMVELIQLRHRFDTEKVAGGGVKERVSAWMGLQR